MIEMVSPKITEEQNDLFLTMGVQQKEAETPGNEAKYSRCQCQLTYIPWF